MRQTTGTTTFSTEPIAKDDPAAAFGHAVEQAQWAHGPNHVGPTGTIADKDFFEIFSDKPVSVSDAWALANEILDDPAGEDLRDDIDSVHCPDGPAGAIRVTTGWVFFGCAHA